MSWCDKLSSTPSVGFELDAHHAPSEHILSNLAPLLDSWGDDKKPNFSVPKLEAFVVHIQHDDGFLYVFEPKKVSVSFQHRIKFRSVSGGLPVGELISKAMPYTKLLEDAMQRLVQVTLLLPNIKIRNIKRTGIVTTTNVDEKDAPPGINRFIDFIAFPWQSDLNSLRVNIDTIVKKEDNSSDKCMHIIQKTDNDEDLLTIVFDYRRYPSKPVKIESNILERELERCKDSALNYFESLAVGDAFDESIIRYNG